MVKQGTKDHSMQRQARLTSKGQITVPIEVRRILGVRAGDKLVFKNDETGIRVRPLRNQSTFSKYRGIGNLASSQAGRASLAGSEMRGE
jgi:AbrB family looped-hinge helix DNA binding protein